MMQIFNFFGSIFGYLLWFLYTIFQNYGVAIILFTIIVKALVFPFSIKSQKSMAAQSRLAAKQKELQARYGNDKMKYNEELQKLCKAGIFSAESVGSVCGINGQGNICPFYSEGKRTGCSRSVGEVTASERQGLGVAHVCLQACRSALHRELDGCAVCR